MSARAQAPEPLSGAAGSILRASNAEWVSGWGWTVQRLSSRRTGPRRESRQRRTAIPATVSSTPVLMSNAQTGISGQTFRRVGHPTGATLNQPKTTQGLHEKEHSADIRTTDRMTGRVVGLAFGRGVNGEWIEDGTYVTIRLDRDDARIGAGACEFVYIGKAAA